MGFLFDVCMWVFKILIICFYKREISHVSSVYKKKGVNTETALYWNSKAEASQNDGKMVRLFASVKPRETNHLLQEDNKINIPTSVYKGVGQYIYIYIYISCGPGSSVGIATELRAGESGIESRWGWDFPLVQTGPGAHPAFCKMGTGGKVRSGRAADHSSPSRAAVMEE